MWPWLEGLGKKVGFILIAAMTEVFVESPFPQFTPERWRLRREPSGLSRLQMSQWWPRELSLKNTVPERWLMLASFRETGKRAQNWRKTRMFFRFRGTDSDESAAALPFLWPRCHDAD